MNTRKRIEIVNEYLILLLGFSIPISSTMDGILITLIFLLWLISGGLKEKMARILKNRAILSFLLLFLLYLIGLLWTEDGRGGLYLVKKGRYLLLAPIIYTGMESQKIRELAIKSFILGVIFAVFIFYLAYFGIIESEWASPGNPTVINHIPYSVHLSLAIFLLARLSTNRYILPIIIFMLINLFMQEGRTGQVAFFCLMILFTIQRYGTRGILYGVLGILLLSALAYGLSPPFERRVKTAIGQFEQFKEGEIVASSSIGVRLYWWQKSLEIIRKNPIFGVGTGDFSIEYAKIDQENIPTSNPHNNYLLILTIFGIAGFLVFSNIFYQAIKYSFILPKGASIQALVLAMLVYMFFDSPMMGHSMIFFTYLSGLLLKDEG